MSVTFSYDENSVNMFCHPTSSIFSYWLDDRKTSDWQKPDPIDTAITEICKFEIFAFGYCFWSSITS